MPAPDVPEPPDNSPGKVAEKYQQERQNTYQLAEDDGPLIVVIKSIYGLWVWHGFIEWYVPRWLKAKNLYERVMATEEKAKAVYNKAVERFWLWWTLALVLCYGAAFGIAQEGPVTSLQGERAIFFSIAVVVLGVVCLFRILEILAVSFRLHVLEKYKTNMPAHALSLTFLAYFQALVCFAVLYLVEGFFTGDPFNANQPIWSCFLNAAYFSTITIATIGYGDYAPTHWTGRLLVMFEAFVGLILLVVAIGRVLSATTPPSQGNGN